MCGGTAAGLVTSSVSGLLRDSAYLRQARSRRLPCYPGVAATTLDRPLKRARGGHDHGSGGPLLDLTNCAICLLGLDCSSIGCRPRSFRVYSRSWNYLVTARTVQGMARVRPGRLLPDPYLLVRSVRRGSRVKRDFACTFTWLFSPVLVVGRSRSRLRLEGRARTLSGPSPDLSAAGTLLHLAASPIRRYPHMGIGPVHISPSPAGTPLSTVHVRPGPPLGRASDQVALVSLSSLAAVLEVPGTFRTRRM